MALNPVDLAPLRRLALFASTGEPAFARLMDRSAMLTVRRGAELAREGQDQDMLYVLLDGVLELSSAWNARDTTLALLRPVSTFALATVILRTPALTNARALTRCHVLAAPGAAVRDAARADAGLAAAVMEELSGCYASVVRVLKNCKLRSAQERLANYLLSLYQREGGAATFQLPCPKRVLASLLDMTPENLSRAFASLAEHGVTVEGPRITLNQPTALIRLGKPDALIEGHAAPHLGQLGQAARERRRSGLDLRNFT